MFTLLSPEESSALETQNDPYDSRKVAAALRAMGAINDQHTVRTRALGMVLMPQEGGESNERFDERMIAVERNLRRLARRELIRLTFGEGRNLQWCLPAGVVPDPDADILG